MRIVSINYPGPPFPKPRMTQQDKWKKRPPVVAWYQFKDAFVAFANSAGLEPDDIVYELGFKVWLPFPQSYSNPKKDWLSGLPHIFKPDVDNIVKSFMDAIARKDQRVHYLHNPKKFWDDGLGARCEVKLWVSKDILFNYEERPK